MIKKASEILNEMCMEKVAKTRVQKMVDAGKITDRATLDKIYELKAPKNNIHNRIEAKAKRISSEDYKTPTSIKDYNKMSNINNLKHIAAIDSRRQTKDMGHHAEKVISKLNQIGKNISGINPKFDNKKDPFNGDWKGKGAVQTRRYSGPDKGNPDVAETLTLKGNDGKNAYRFTLPNPKAKITAPNLSKSTKDVVSKETRAIGALHEILGEGKQSAIVSHVNNKLGFNDNAVRDALNMGSHVSPLVLTEDAKRINRFSPFAQQREYVSRSSTQRAKHAYNGSVSQDAAMKTLKMRGPAQKNMDPELLGERGLQTRSEKIRHLLSPYRGEMSRPSVPWFKGSLPNQQEKRRMLINMIYHNGYGLGPESRKVAREYAKTNFWDLK